MNVRIDKELTKKVVLSLVFVVFSLVASASIGYTAFDIKNWQYSRDINIPQSEDFVKIILPDNVSAGGSNFSDIRIMTEDGIEVPYFLTKNPVIRGGEVATRILDQTVVNGSTEFILDTGEQGRVHTGLRFELLPQNFRRMVAVYSSTSLSPLNSSSWNIVTNKAFVFKFTDPYTEFSSGKNNIDFSANTSRYLKVVIGGGTEGPVSVSSATAYGDTRIDVPSYEKDVSVSIFNNPNKKTTEITLDLGENGNITNSIILNSSDRNFSRRVIIESSNKDTSSWKLVAEGSVSNISTSLFSGSSLQVTYPEQKTRYIRASIVNDDNRPLAIGNTARVLGPIISAIFETRSNESYRLYYGNSTARQPVYDIARISSYIETNKLSEGLLGSEITNPLYVAPVAPAVPFTEANRTLLNVFLVIVVLLIGAGIGWYLYSYMKGWSNIQGPRSDIGV